MACKQSFSGSQRQNKRPSGSDGQQEELLQPVKPDGSAQNTLH